MNQQQHKPRAYSHAVEINYPEVTSPSLAATIKFELLGTLVKRFPSLNSQELRESVEHELDKFHDLDSTPTAFGASSPTLSGATVISGESVDGKK